MSNVHFFILRMAENAENSSELQIVSSSKDDLGCINSPNEDSSSTISRYSGGGRSKSDILSYLTDVALPHKSKMAICEHCKTQVHHQTK